MRDGDVMGCKNGRGRKKNWHGWAFRLEDGSLCYWAESSKPPEKPLSNGQWMKVRFVEVK